MQLRVRPSLVTLLLAAACAAVIAALFLWRTHRESTVADLMERLPDSDAPVLYVDVAALRDSGLLDLLVGDGAAEETEYRDFVRESGFDYRTDLDGVAASFGGDGTSFFLLRGRFDWGQLVEYVESNQGDCHNGLCRIRASVPGRHISFLAVTPSLMAFASGPDPWAVTALNTRYRTLNQNELPGEPVWLTVSGASLSRAKWAPEGTQLFATALAGAGTIVFAASPAEEGLIARMRVDCGSEDRAAKLKGELDGVTKLLTALTQREPEAPAATGVSGILASGTFRRAGAIVAGEWRVPLRFLEELSAVEQ